MFQSPSHRGSVSRRSNQQSALGIQPLNVVLVVVAARPASRNASPTTNLKLQISPLSPSHRKSFLHVAHHNGRSARLNLNLPTGGVADSRQLQKQDIRTIEVSRGGIYMLGGRAMPLNQIAAQLVNEHRLNPRLVVDIRGDENAPYKFVTAIFDLLSRAGIESVSLRSKPPPR